MSADASEFSKNIGYDGKLYRSDTIQILYINAGLTELTVNF